MASNEKGYGIVTAVGGGDSQVEIRRDLSEGNALGDPAAWDPIVDVIFHAEPGKLHGDAPLERQTQQLESLRLSDVYRLLHGLQEALAAGARVWILPPPLTDHEWGERVLAAYAERDLAAGKAPVLAVDSDDDGEEWKRERV